MVAVGVAAPGENQASEILHGYVARVGLGHKNFSLYIFSFIFNFFLLDSWQIRVQILLITQVFMAFNYKALEMTAKQTTNGLFRCKTEKDLI